MLVKEKRRTHSAGVPIVKDCSRFAPFTPLLLLLLLLLLLAAEAKSSALF